MNLISKSMTYATRAVRITASVFLLGTADVKLPSGAKMHFPETRV